MSDTETTACERWADLSDRRLLGETISEDDESFVAAHLAECQLCQAEARVWSELGQAPPALETERATALVEGALAGARRGSTSAAPPAEPRPATSLIAVRRRRLQITSGIAAALAVAAAAAIWLRPSPQKFDEPLPIATLGDVRGEVTIDGEPATEGDPIAVGTVIATREGRACFQWTPGQRACLAEDSSATLGDGGSSVDMVELAQGTVVSTLEPLPKGRSFVVRSGGARVTVKGTIFSVTKLPTEPAVVVRVHQGVVAAESSITPVRDVSAGQELDLGRGTVGAISTAVRRRELEVVGVYVPEPAAEPTAKIAPRPSLGDDAGKTPKATAVDAGKSAAEMLQEARALRAQGNASGAAAAYRRLQAQHPKSAEAHASRLSLAELMLGPLGDPSGALAAYDAYLRGGGGLQQEARYGRILALRRLGRAGEANSAVEEFVRDYPNSVQARALSGKASDAAAP